MSQVDELEKEYQEAEQTEMDWTESPKARFTRELHEDGEAVCPCCEIFHKIYDRKFGAVMARQLIKLYKLGAHADNNGWTHVSKFSTPTGTGDFSKLRYWGLVEEMRNETTKKRTSGFWRITDQGVRVVRGEDRVPEYCRVLNKVPLEFKGEYISCKEALENKFNYEELMS